ncbi:GTPase IMAP family member 8-like [Colossoma macropomum]|uniref:GTPase IMAP family member 8-like n=1 Tax=Colossoma macropomum TaxID=42526 RepID=UPI001864077D|nr:GTPase IMAP family member 8-like [Colossoma macropomum]
MSQVQEASSNVTGTELRAVILGWHKAGKTSVINTILGPGVAVSVSGQCLKKEGYVNGRKITLVDTPGWWKDCSIRDSPELCKQAVMRSVSLCPPGPHAFLLVIQADLLFKEKFMEPLVQHMELLSERVWAHTIVLFTGGDSLTNMSIEQRIQTGGEPLQKLLEKCGNRYHVFDNFNTSNRTQVSTLFEKIDNVVSQNCGRSFEIDLEVLQGLERRWEEVQRRAAARQSKVQEERSLIKDKAYLRHLEELRMVLLGWVMSGKSSAGNTILKQEGFMTGERTTKCIRRFGDVAGRKMAVLDTPGYWKFFSSKFNPEWVQAAVLKDVLKCKKFPHGVLLVLPADTSFKEEQKKIIEENMAIFGEQIWRHTIVLFTWGDFLGDALIEQHIESEGEALQWLIDKCGNRYHVFDNTKRGDDAQVTELLEKIEEMVAGNCLFRPDVTELSEMKAELLLDTSEEVWIEDFLNLFKEEWNRRTKEFRENLEQLWAESRDSTMKSYRSKTPPPKFHGEDESTDTPETFGPECKTDSAQVFNTKQHLLSLVEREWSRQEAIVMEKVCTTLLHANLADDGFSEMGEKEISASVAKVERWLSGCEHEKHMQ